MSKQVWEYQTIKNESTLVTWLENVTRVRYVKDLKGMTFSPTLSSANEYSCLINPKNNKTCAVFKKGKISFSRLNSVLSSLGMLTTQIGAKGSIVVYEKLQS